jgi:transcriptional regulator with XRE-family HTH domain
MRDGDVAAGLRSTFGAAVRRRRQGMGMSQRAMAARYGLSQRLLSAVETGADNMTVRTMVRLATAVDGDVPKMLTRCE